MTTTPREPTTPIIPVDPQSPRGRELAAALTVALDDVADAIARRKATRKTGEAA